MATPLDTSLIQHFDIIFPFLLVLVLMYAVLSKIKIFSSASINAIISFVVAVMFLMSPLVREVLNTAAPWFILLFVFIIFSLVAYMALGAEQSDILNVVKSTEYRYISFWILALILIITLGSLAHVVSKYGGFGSDVSVDPDQNRSDIPSDPSYVVPEDQQQDFWQTIVHPKVLGMVFIMLTAMFTIMRLVKE